jgi:coproporphyrinogen III oxidase-like Fe-S oxidoreductase
MLESFIGKNFSRLLIKEKVIALENKIPSLEDLSRRFRHIDELGIYLHIPFCEQICPYCPYNKEIYNPDMAARYTIAVKKEIDCYADVIGRRPITSFYIGGGTPTTMLHSGIEDIIDHLFNTFNMQCEIHIESHPNHLSVDNLDKIVSMGVDHLSIGVESLQDRHLRTLKRSYTTEEVKAIVKRAVSKNFKCVNVDFIFALPDQTYIEVEQAGQTLVGMDVDQERFGKDFDSVYGKYMELLSFLGFLKDDGNQIVLTDKGTYWLHAFEDLFSIDYISKLWGTSRQNPWPKKIVLQN